MFVPYNPNPKAARVGDCAVRAVSKATGQSWEKTYLDLCIYGFLFCDLPSANIVWGRYLRDHGYNRYMVPDISPSCYTVRSFAEEFPVGKYVLALAGHVVSMQNGNYFDTFDSGDESILYFWRLEEDV